VEQAGQNTTRACVRACARAGGMEGTQQGWRTAHGARRMAHGAWRTARAVASSEQDTHRAAVSKYGRACVRATSSNSVSLVVVG